MKVFCLSRRYREPFVVFWDERLPQESIRARNRIDLPESQFFDQPVLPGFKEPFNPSLGLGAVRGREINAQLPHGPLELRAEIFILMPEPFRQAICAEFIEIYRDRLPAFFAIPFPKSKHRQNPLVVGELGTQDAAGCVVDRGQETRLPDAAAVFKPVMIRSVELDEFADMGAPLAPYPMDGILRPS